MPGVMVKSRIGGISAKAESQSTAFRILLRYEGVFMTKPVPMLLSFIGRTCVAAETSGLARRERLSLEPDGRRLGVRGAGQILLDALEPLLGLVWLTEPGISIGNADHQLAAFVRPEVAEIRAL